MNKNEEHFIMFWSSGAALLKIQQFINFKITGIGMRHYFLFRQVSDNSAIAGKGYLNPVESVFQ